MNRFEAESSTWPKKPSEAIFFVEEFLKLNKNKKEIYLSKKALRYIANVAYYLQQKHDWFRSQRPIIFVQEKNEAKEVVFYMTQIKKKEEKRAYRANACFDCTRFRGCPKVLDQDIVIFKYPFISGVQEICPDSQKNTFYIKECDFFVKEEKRKTSSTRGASAYLEHQKEKTTK